MQTIAVKELPPTELVCETAYSASPLGKHPSTMTFYADREHYGIEWNIPALDRTVDIGLVFEYLTLVDYDGVFSLPKEAIELIREVGFTVPPDMEE